MTFSELPSHWGKGFRYDLGMTFRFTTVSFSSKVIVPVIMDHHHNHGHLGHLGERVAVTAMIIKIPFVTIMDQITLLSLLLFYFSITYITTSQSSFRWTLCRDLDYPIFDPVPDETSWILVPGPGPRLLH